MFGIRPDGKVNKKIDPIVRMTSMLMPQRCDSMVMLKKEIDYDALSDYIKKKRAEGIKVSHMSIIVSAFIRVLNERSEFNRFVMNRKIYDRNEKCVSYTILKEKIDNNFTETTVKTFFTGKENIFEISQMMQHAIEENREVENRNFTDKLAKLFLSVPFIPIIAVQIIRIMDRYGILPKTIIDASPLHTSMFITNMASIKMNYVYHHIYNFGTTSIFFSMGKKEEKLIMDKNGNIIKKYIMPLGIVIDERICSGAEYARGIALMEKYLNNPQLLENQDTSIEEPH